MQTKKIHFGAFSRFKPYLLHYPKEIIGALILGILSGFSTVLMTYYIGKSVDTMVGKGQVNAAQLIKILGLLAGILLVTVLSQWLIQRLGNRVSYLSTTQLRKDAFAHLNQLPLSYYDQTSHGNIVSRFTNDIDNISMACSAVFNQLFSGMATVVVALLFMIRLSPLLTLVVLISTPIIFIVNWLVAKASQKNFAAQQTIVGEISGFVSEMVGNQKIVKAFQQEQATQETFEALNQTLYEKGQKAQFSSSLTNPLSRFIDHLSYLSIGLVGGLLVLSGNPLVTVGVISSFTIYSSQFSKPFIELSGITNQIQAALAGLERTFDMMDQPVERPDAPNAIVLKEARGRVEFKDVDFSYTPTRPLIENFNLIAEPGETIAIVGRTGAGKSTLVNLLMRFYEVDRGQITVDTHDITQITRDSLRKSFGMVLQDTWLFDSSIRENLTYGNPETSDEEIIEAMKKAHIFDFVMRLPQGLDTEIGSQGVKISEGQRQLMTIARTMISNPPMLILDEATSSVDTLTEQKIQDAFLQMMTGRTSFVIAHRLATIKSAEKILVMDNGQVVEIGTHDELLQKEQGYYRDLYEAQFNQKAQ
ncbi:ABC transporter ATP-binding protein [Enterococcus faecalis]|uniref:ABC transporter ATP-binding protein n=1 Tax=Enterococcus faecalis TaxID=1351 RepID=UPI00045B092B|nr:ABC transporter ATP-binding protein [Enterococcus faecalis]EGO5053128.1 ABC transporter ATP-binding protein [Enterococcus faecalis]EGO7850140.1 ABC transporter ATP-binding protein [Enterococcus faecalis]EKN1382092.1 ABC transporter ATP-binding protein [Enterococcus faecalis]KAJ68573.1 Lipid A export ATP-binding/permease protein MsbA [Enterococcus faecalis MD6]MBO6323552.1 ABC transporter ATP-binding protein [Enterococcus faecalis]